MGQSHNISKYLNINTCIYKSTVAYAREVNYGKKFKYRNDYGRS